MVAVSFALQHISPTISCAVPLDHQQYPIYNDFRVECHAIVKHNTAARVGAKVALFTGLNPQSKPCGVLVNHTQPNSHPVKPQRNALLSSVPLLALSLILASTACSAHESNKVDAAELSLDSLLNISIVTASKYEQSSADVPASVTVVTADDIRRNGWQSFEELISSVRGFYLTDDHLYQYTGVRGFGRPGDYNTRIAVLINGQTTNESVYDQAAAASNFTIDLAEIERVEIVRGPGSALYGTGAMLAVINVLLRDPGSRSGFQTSVTGGENGYRRGLFSYSGKLKNGAAFSLAANGLGDDGPSLYYGEFDTPETNYGRADVADWENQYGSTAQFRYKKWNSSAYLMSRTKGNGAAAWGTQFNNDNMYIRDTYIGLQVKRDLSISPRVSGSSRAYFDGYVYSSLYLYEDEVDHWYEYSEHQRIGTELQTNLELSSAHRFIAGLVGEYSFRDYTSGDQVNGSDGFEMDKPLSSLSAYAQGEFTLTHELLLTAGGRVMSYNNGQRAAVPRAALVWHPTQKSSLRAMFGQAFRVPSIFEAYYQKADEWVANPDLKPEMITTGEFEFEQRIHRHWQGVLSFYRYNLDDLIDEYSGEENELPYYFNNGSAVTDGSELELHHRTGKGLHTTLGWAYQWNTQNGDNQALTNSPQHIGRAQISAPLGRYVVGATDFRYESGRLTLTQSETQDFATLNIALTSSQKLRPWGLTLRAKNVFDAHYDYPTGAEFLAPINSVDLPAVPQRGRQITLRLDYEFGSR